MRTCSPVCRSGTPEVQIVFADTRAFAEDWTYRFLAARRRHGSSRQGLTKPSRVFGTSFCRTTRRSLVETGFPRPTRGTFVLRNVVFLLSGVAGQRSLRSDRARFLSGCDEHDAALRHRRASHDFPE